MPDIQQRYYACQNPQCQWYERTRVLFPQRLTGDGLYTWPKVFCECGLNVELRQVESGQLELDLTGTEPCS